MTLSELQGFTGGSTQQLEASLRPILDAQNSPEDVVQRVRDFDAETLVFIDIAIIGSPPGAVKMIS